MKYERARKFLIAKAQDAKHAAIAAMESDHREYDKIRDFVDDYQSFLSAADALSNAEQKQ